MDIKLLIAGGRDFEGESAYKSLSEWVDLIRRKYNVVEIISGTARGADTLGEKYAVEHNIPIKRFPAQWNIYGKRAGYLRNSEMGDYCDKALIFWDGKSRGTNHMINLLKEKGKGFKLVTYTKK